MSTTDASNDGVLATSQGFHSNALLIVLSDWAVDHLWESQSWKK